ncbi:MAG: CotH kinase family protein [Bacteroidaceae bacterium]|nr:CotH kinase family protein [Bacteroidaceae bacterium]
MRRNLFTISLILFALYPLIGFSQITLSHKHGLYSTAFQLTMSSDEPNATIYYTTNGSVPTAQSNIYSGPITINTTTVIRAVAISPDDEEAPSITTASYIFPKEVLKQPNNPEGFPNEWGPYAEQSQNPWGGGLHGNAPADYEMDPEMTNNSYLAPIIEAGLSQLPIVSLVTDKDNFFSHENDADKGGIYIYTGAPVGTGDGRGWVRPTSFELFGGEFNHDLTVDGGVQIHGGHGRLPEKNPKHSMRIKFKKEYGPKEIHYPVFGENYNDEYDVLVFRSPFGNAWQHWLEGNRTAAQYTRDMWARSTQRRMGHPYSNGQYCHMFIDGLYWGIYIISERINDSYCEAHFGGKKKHYDVIKVEETEGNVITPDCGDLVKWNAMYDLVHEVGDNTKYLQLQGLNANGEPDDNIEPLLEVDNFIDYMLINFYAGNTDWDHHNWFAFRNQFRNDTGFRFICWDSELIFGNVNENVVTKDTQKMPTRILKYLTNNNNFKHRFMSRAYKHLNGNGLLTPDKAVEVWDSLYHKIEFALYTESARWGDYRRDVHPYTSQGVLYTVEGTFARERNRMLNEYFPQRTNIVINQLKNAGLYSNVTPPTIRLNNDIVKDGFNVILKSDVVKIDYNNNIYYTINGKEPVDWATNQNGDVTSSAIRLNNNNTNILSNAQAGDTIVVKAIRKEGNNWSASWSPTVEYSFFVYDPNSINEATAIAPQSNGIFDMQGRRLRDDRMPKHQGIYIINGKKVFIK